MTVQMEDKHNEIRRPDWLPEGLWPSRIRTAHPLQRPVAYTDEGAGPTLLLVHDGMWSFIWGQVIEHLKEEFRVITLDFPGSGLSPAANYPVGLEADSQLLEAFIEELNLTELNMVLHDLGGPVGVGLAARRPSLVQGFVFTQTFAWPPHMTSLRAMLRLVSSRPMTNLDVATNLVFRMTTTSLGVGRHLDNRARRAFLGPYRNRGPRRRFHTLMGSAHSELEYLEEVEDALRTSLSSKPVLTIYGENNDPFGFQRRFKEIFPKAEEMVVPRGNHFPMADAPEMFSDRLVGWHRVKIAAESERARA